MYNQTLTKMTYATGKCELDIFRTLGVFISKISTSLYVIMITACSSIIKSCLKSIDFVTSHFKLKQTILQNFLKGNVLALSTKPGNQ